MDCMYNSLELRWLRFRQVRRLKITIARRHQLVFTGPGELTFLQPPTTNTLSFIAAYGVGLCFVKQNILLLIVMSFFQLLPLNLRIRNGCFSLGTAAGGTYYFLVRKMMLNECERRSSTTTIAGSSDPKEWRKAAESSG